jgi:hypothetical protein
LCWFGAQLIAHNDEDVSDDDDINEDDITEDQEYEFQITKKAPKLVK